MSIINKIVSDRVRLKSMLTLSIYVALMVVAAIVFSKFVDKDSLQAVVERSGKLGIVIYFFVQVIYVTLTPMFNTAILIASGYIFGGHIGFILNFLATSAGLFLIVFLVKKYGRPSSKFVGLAGESAAWLIAQHSDYDVKFQERCLKSL